MAKKQHQMPDGKNISVRDRWNPTRPFHGTQEEWWDHFHEIEKGTFYPAEETFQRVQQWLENRK
ncbi:MAG: hypothetical protein LBD21_10665 [Tannerellaceae bacterium]|jgi:hypothetical protein|nr:hypothetical protein [Tannerellaceae bacterium]